MPVRPDHAALRGPVRYDALMRRTSLALAASVLAATLTGCGTSFGPEAGASMYSAAVASQSSKSAEQATSTPSAPTTAAASTEEPAPSTEPAPAPTSSTAPARSSLAATVEDAINQGGIGRPTWAAPIVEVEELDASSVRLTYQESLPTDAAREDLATKVHAFTKAEGAQLDTIIIRDTSGVDTNVYCGQTICSTSLVDTDR